MFLYGFSELPIVFNGCLTTCLDLSESFSWLLQYFRTLSELDGYLSQVDIQVFCCTNGIAPCFFPYVPRYSFSTALCFMANLKIPPEESDYWRFFLDPKLSLFENFDSKKTGVLVQRKPWLVCNDSWLEF